LQDGRDPGPNPTVMKPMHARMLTAALVGAAIIGAGGAMSITETHALQHVSSNAYSWQVLYARDRRDFGSDLSAAFRSVKAAGLDGYEPILGSPDDVVRIGSALRQAGLEMRSAYVNTTLHRKPDDEESILSVLAIARQARRFGTKILVTNPNPIQWGAAQDKSDSELETQAAALNRLGKELKTLGIALAYHNHDIELRQAARELHHMMAGTDPACVRLCLDAHWIYRGAGNSHIALLDFVKLYGKRIVEVHLRQSRDGIWSEVFGDGDIDYGRLVAMLGDLRIRPHLVLEQAAEAGTPKTLSAEEAMGRSASAVRALFAGAR